MADVTGQGAIVAPASVISGSGRVIHAVRHAVRVERRQIILRVRGALLAPRAEMMGAGLVNDDEAVLQLIEL